MTVETLMAMTQRELDELFRASRPGAVPPGSVAGRFIVAPAGRLSPLLAHLGRLVWRGKTFGRGELVNRVTPLGVRAVRAQVFEAPSLLDGAPAIVFDYSRTSHIARPIRDEVREVAPGLYLGIVYCAGRKTINFALTAS